MFYRIALVSVLIFGCVHLRLTPTSTCQPLSGFDKLVIYQFDGGAAFVEEEQYRRIPQFIAADTPEKLRDQIEARHLFKTVVLASDCSGHAIKVDGKLYRLIHHH